MVPGTGLARAGSRMQLAALVGTTPSPRTRTSALKAEGLKWSPGRRVGESGGIRIQCLPPDGSRKVTGMRRQQHSPGALCPWKGCRYREERALSMRVCIPVAMSVHPGAFEPRTGLSCLSEQGRSSHSSTPPAPGAGALEGASPVHPRSQNSQGFFKVLFSLPRLQPSSKTRLPEVAAYESERLEKAQAAVWPHFRRPGCSGPHLGPQRLVLLPLSCS